MPPPAAAQSDDSQLRDELERQFRLLRAEMPIRLIATMLAYAMGLLYLPWVFVLIVALLDLLGEAVTHWVFSDLTAMVRQRWRRHLAVGAIFLIETCFALPAALIWHFEDPYAKALAVGLAAGSMMHLATVRSIHLPQGIAAALALSILLIGSNTVYWVNQGMWQGFAITTVCALVSLGYFFEAMLSTHRLHRDTAMGRRAALEANAAKDRLLATISHELRTPLNGIVGMAHAEWHHATTPGATERLDLLVASADGLTTLLDDILDLSAAREGRLPIRPTNAHPRTEIERTIGLFLPAIARQGVEFSRVLDPSLDAPAVFDAQRLRQCLSNLLSNALKHGQGAPILLKARAMRCPDGNPILDIVVEDSGPGIPSEDAARAFEPFGQLSQGADGARRGHGLGLSITRTLARQMGGDLLLDPSNEGARFRLYVLLYPAPGIPAPVAPAAPAALPRLDGCRVLVVDDVGTNRIVAASYLRLAGALPLEAASGEAAMEVLAAGGVDAVLLDLHMPGLDGPATLAALRALPGPAGHVPVIAMTADADPRQRHRWTDAGIDGHLPKPLTPERMVAEILRALHQRSRLDAPAPTRQSAPAALTGTDP